MTDKRIVIIGGGFGGLFTALDLSGAGQVTLISNEDHFLFTPMLYEYLSGEVEAWHIAPNQKELLDESVKFIHDEVVAVDLSARTVSLKTGDKQISYDVLVVGVGGVSNFAGVEGAAEHAIPFRKIADADNLRQRMVHALDHVPPDLPPQDTQRALTFAVVGAGASGVELATKMADLLRDAFKRRALRGEPRVLVIEMGDRVVPGMGEEIREIVEDALLSSHVEVHTLTRVVRVEKNSLTIEHEGKLIEIETAAVAWTGGVRVSPLVESLDLEKTDRGLIIVSGAWMVGQQFQRMSMLAQFGPNLKGNIEAGLETYKRVADFYSELPIQIKVTGSYHDNVFALGDIAYFTDATPTLAGTAQLALQEAGLLAKNIEALLNGKELQTKHFAELGEAVSLGTERAAVLAGGKVFGGALARFGYHFF